MHQADVQYFVTAVFKNQFSLDGAGVAVGQLRSYSIPAGPGCTGPILFTSSFTGYPCYLDGFTQPFNLYQIPVGYRDGTPTPLDVDYNWGPFGDNYVHLFTIVTSRPLWRGLTLGLEYDGTYERAFSNGVLDSQWLRRDLARLQHQQRELADASDCATSTDSAASQRRSEIISRSGSTSGSPPATSSTSTTEARRPERRSTVSIVKFVFHAGADAGT